MLGSGLEFAAIRIPVYSIVRQLYGPINQGYAAWHLQPYTHRHYYTFGDSLFFGAEKLLGATRYTRSA